MAPACPLSPSTAGAPLLAGRVAPHTHSPHSALCGLAPLSTHRASTGHPQLGACHLLRWELHGCREVLQKQPPPPARQCRVSAQQVGWRDFHRQHGTWQEKNPNLLLISHLPMPERAHQKKRIQNLHIFVSVFLTEHCD